MLAAAACGRRDEPRPAPAKPSADAAVRTLADAYLAGYFDRNPDAVTVYGVPGRRHDKLPDNSLDALNAWHAREDAWIAQAKQIDPAAIETPALRATYAIVREALEGSAAARVCRYELWTVSQMVNGWQAQLGYLVTIQPVGTDQARADALARWSRLPRYVDTDSIGFTGATGGSGTASGTSASVFKKAITPLRSSRLGSKGQR